MTYVKSFPKRSDKSVYPQWEEISLTYGSDKGIVFPDANANIFDSFVRFFVANDNVYAGN